MVDKSHCVFFAAGEFDNEDNALWSFIFYLNSFLFLFFLIVQIVMPLSKLYINCNAHLIQVPTLLVYSTCLSSLKLRISRLKRVKFIIVHCTLAGIFFPQRYFSTLHNCNKHQATAACSINVFLVNFCLLF